MQDGVLEYQYDSAQPGGGIKRHRLIFFKLGPDSVPQFSEYSADDGKRWTTEIDLTWIRKRSDCLRPCREAYRDAPHEMKRPSSTSAPGNLL